MPNIIEQQDLLKGLPDARLAMLLQNPVADIPPFLVAAEAQRRQAIRQQFASEAPQESVVDTLTKQIANVPQNVNAPTRTPPMVPPTPPMQGVAALQQQQAMANIAQQAQQPQMMRGGGMVQRYQAAGLVQPSSIYTPSTNPIENIARTYMLLNPGMTYEEAMQRAGIGTELPRASEKEIAAANAGKISSEMGGIGNYSILRGQPKEPEGAGSETGEDFNMSVALPDVAVGGKQPAPPKPRPRPDYLIKPKPGETPDEFRARLEELLKAQEPSDWEKAQKWFAMSEQFLDPSKTTMQSIAGAGRAFSESAAEQARARRDAELALKKGLLEYDIGKAQSRSEAEAAAAKDQREFEQRMMERGTPSADAAISALTRSMLDIDDQIQKLSVGLIPGEPPPPENQTQIERLLKVRKGLNEQLINIMDRGGFINRKIITDEDLAALGI